MIFKWFKRRKTPKQKYAFRVRHNSEDGIPVIDFWCDHKSEGFPDIYGLLEAEYGAVFQPLSEGMVVYALATDEVIHEATCKKGRISIHDDIWDLSIAAEGKSDEIIRDIEAILLASGDFEKIEEDLHTESNSHEQH